MRNFERLAFACSILLFATFAAAQQGDILISGSTLMSAATTSDLVGFHQPPEKGGAYVGISADYIRLKNRLGLNVESSWRYHRADYDGYESYRPILTDINALFEPRVTKKVSLDFFAGVGLASTRFNLAASCNSSGCVNYNSSNHFMEDFGGGVRYYVWRHIFVRPEAHYYHIQNNIEFNSDNVFRVGASVGITLGPEK